MDHHEILAPDGFRLAAQVSGRRAADAPTVLLLAGQANSHRWWTGLREDLEDRWRMVSLDQRGTGASRGPVGEWTTRSFADDAAAVLDGLGVARAHVYGTSMGGRVAQWLAADRPERVDRLVLACTSPGGPHAVERAPDVRRALASPDPEPRRATLQWLFHTDAWPVPAQESHLFGDPTMTAAEARAHLRASARHDAWDVLPGVTAPTLVLHGTDDAMAPVANAHLLADRVPGARLHLVEGGRHGFFAEQRSEVVPLVRAFLGEDR